MRKLKIFWKLPLKYKVLLINDVVLITIVKVLRDLIPFKVLMKMIRTLSSSSLRIPLNYSKKELSWAVELVSKYLLKDRPCLVQALVLWFQFKRREYSASLHIGVKKEEEDGMAAHAWVESKGIIWIGWLHNLQEYQNFPALEGFSEL